MKFDENGNLINQKVKVKIVIDEIDGLSHQLELQIKEAKIKLLKTKSKKVKLKQKELIKKLTKKLKLAYKKEKFERKKKNKRFCDFCGMPVRHNAKNRFINVEHNPNMHIFCTKSCKLSFIYQIQMKKQLDQDNQIID